MIKKFLFFILMACIVCGCSKKNRLSVDSFQLKLNPGAGSVDPGGQIQITAYGESSKKTDISVTVTWILDPDSMGSLSSTTGQSTVFTASSGAYGTVRILAFYGDFTSETQIGVGITDILNDLHSAGYVGVFAEGGATFITSDDKTIFKEGIFSTRADYNLPSSSDGGIYVEEGGLGGAETRNMTSYANGNLRFWIKTPVDLEIKVNNKAVQLSTLGAYTNNVWHEIVIPISSFALGGGISAISKFITVSVISNGVYNGNQPISGSFYIDDVRWTKK
jgi:hypothetical protein